jgi:hypothetical protein
MKIQIDTAGKIICIEETVLLAELLELLDQLFPNLAWKEYSLQTKIINNWTNPIIIKEHPKTQPYPWINPYSNPTVMYGCPSVIPSGNTYNIQY